MKKRTRNPDTNYKNWRQHIEMEFGTGKCIMLIIKNEKRETAKRIKQQNQESIRKLREKENDYYLRLLEGDTIKQTEMKEKNKKSVPQKNEKTSQNQVF